MTPNAGRPREGTRGRRDAASDRGQRTGRVSYAAAGAAMRDTLRRAIEARIREKPTSKPKPLTGRQWKVLNAVLAFTASYSKLSDELYLGQLAALVYGVKWANDDQRGNVGRELSALASANLIRYTPAPAGRPGNGPRPKSRVEIFNTAGSDSVSPGNLSEPTSNAVRLDSRNTVRSDPPTEEVGTEEFLTSGRHASAPLPVHVSAIWDAIETACELDYFFLSDSETQLVGEAAFALADIGVSPADVSAAAGSWRRRSPSKRLTVGRLAGQWSIPSDPGDGE